MHSPIRHYLYTRLLAAILLTGLLTSIGCAIGGILMFRGFMSRAVAASRTEVTNRLKVFDLILTNLVRDSVAAGRRALIALADRYPDLRAAASATHDQLRADAIALGVDEIYFIGEDGRIFATSFPKDLGLDLFSLDPAFVAFLKAIFRSGTLVEQGIAESTLTGIVNKYQYYGPPGRPFVIEVSTRLSTMVAAAYPGLNYASFASTMLGLDRGTDLDPPVRIVDYLVDNGASMVEEHPKDMSIARRLSGFAEPPSRVEWHEGSSWMILERFDLGIFDANSRHYVLLRVDESYYALFVALSLTVALVCMGGASLVANAGARKVLGPKIASRLEQLASAMERVGMGEDALILHDELDDELSVIGRSAAEMVRTIRLDAEELRVFARRLEEEIEERERKEAALSATLESNRELLHEVDHRVKNNLQLMASLAQLEASTDPAAGPILAKMEARLVALALVEDRLNADLETRLVEAAPLLQDLVERTRSCLPEAARRVECRILAGDVRLGAEDAFAVALAALELADNALRHGFPEGRRGYLELRLETLGDGGYALEAVDDGVGLEPGSDGTGLGIVRALAAQRRGRFETSPGAGGAGTRVRFEVPSSGSRPVPRVSAD